MIQSKVNQVGPLSVFLSLENISADLINFFKKENIPITEAIEKANVVVYDKASPQKKAGIGYVKYKPEYSEYILKEKITRAYKGLK